MMRNEEALTQAVGRLGEEAIELAEALHTILSETDEAETVRIAISALTLTETGKNYLMANPIGR